jgi:hypothetical protein
VDTLPDYASQDREREYLRRSIQAGQPTDRGDVVKIHFWLRAPITVPLRDRSFWQLGFPVGNRLLHENAMISEYRMEQRGQTVIWDTDPDGRKPIVR